MHAVSQNVTAAKLETAGMKKCNSMLDQALEMKQCLVLGPFYAQLRDGWPNWAKQYSGNEVKAESTQSGLKLATYRSEGKRLTACTMWCCKKAVFL